MRVRAKSLTRSWLYIYTLNGKRREIGLGSLYDIDLAKARASATELRSMLLDGVDPAEERKRRSIAAKPKPAFGPFAMQLIDSIRCCDPSFGECVNLSMVLLNDSAAIRPRRKSYIRPSKRYSSRQRPFKTANNEDQSRA